MVERKLVRVDQVCAYGVPNSANVSTCIQDSDPIRDEAGTYSSLNRTVLSS